ncbi:MAG: exodeoxyribonuclease V subunit beta [Lentisphaerae bacterium]|nr:exodeoxyribonuclease V subunit beta [Lentisphaerota bacterium]
MDDFTQWIGDPEKDCTGGALVEASAGTGKTYNIQNFYLRLVVSHGLRVENILVVTFTEAATQELRDRLRCILNDCHNFLNTTPDNNNAARLTPITTLPLLDPPANQNANGVRAEQLRRVRRALIDFDSAAIFTIHGFCNRVLQRYAFECGTDPDAELISEQTEIITDICRIWWRENNYSTPDTAACNPFAKFEYLVKAVTAAAADFDATLKPTISEEECYEILNNLKNSLSDDLTKIPEAAGTNEATRKLEEQLQKIKSKNKQISIPFSHLYEFFAAIPADGKVFWKFPGDSKKKEISLRLPESAGLIANAKQALFALQAAIATQLRYKINDSLLDRSAITYDAMLLRLRQALRDAQGGERLKEVLRAEFKAALIDEFQDTDPVQYEIFKTLFGSSDSPFLMVGDPKQSIYSFRSGDIFTYYQAASEIKNNNKASLGTNYRSENNLVEAVNDFFQEGDTTSQCTFMSPHITFFRVKSHGVKPEHQLCDNTVTPDPQPFKIRYYIHTGKPSKDAPVTSQIYNDTADEIVRLLNSSNGITLGDRHLRPSDIAILTCTHDEASHIATALAKRRIPFVKQPSKSIFSSPLAQDFALLLTALLNPFDQRAVNSTLATNLLRNACKQTPTADTSDILGFDEWIALFREAHTIWLQRSFFEAFQFINSYVDIYAHLVSCKSIDPEADIATVRQLAEICHITANNLHLSPTALQRWFSRQLDKEHREEDDSFKERPASDNSAVRIMTIFAAKGLEFPIVFVPTLWRKTPAGTNFPTYHEETDGTAEKIIDLTTSEDGKTAAFNEKLQEDIRLAYVALTRAVNRLYLTAIKNEDGEIYGDPAKYALSYLLTRPFKDDFIFTKDIDQPTAPAGEPTCWEALNIEPLDTPYNNGQAEVDKKHGHTSFSALASHSATATPVARDIDSSDTDTPDPEPQTADDIFLFPGGARTGDCWHAIFEKIDFQSDTTTIRDKANAILNSFNLCKSTTPELEQRKRDAAHNMIAAVLHAPLGTPPDTFSLADIPLTSRRSELTFHFPLRRDTPDPKLSQLADILTATWDTPARNQTFIDTIGKSQRTIPLGYLTGSIDLLFHHNNRFYIVDWKSNRLGGETQNFATSGIAAEMAAHSYYLQYLIYTVAVDGFLRQNLTNYNYDQHFGGAYYLFLRGVRPNSNHGIFHDRPSATTIAHLTTALTYT